MILHPILRYTYESEVSYESLVRFHRACITTFRPVRIWKYWFLTFDIFTYGGHTCHTRANVHVPLYGIYVMYHARPSHSYEALVHVPRTEQPMR